MKSRLFWSSTLLFVVSLSATLFAQDTASLTGTVTDPTGAAIAKAQAAELWEIEDQAERAVPKVDLTSR